MPATPPEYFGNLDSTRPRGTESRTLSDDYQRNMRESCRMQAPNWTGPITATHEDVNKTAGLAAANAKIMTGTAGTTIAPFANASAPIGWTIKTGFEGRMLVTAGTINSTVVAGGDIGGTDDPGLMDKVPAHNHDSGTIAATADGAGGHGHSVNINTSINGSDGFSSNTQCFGRGVSGTGNEYVRDDAGNDTNANVINGVNNHTHTVNISGATADNAGGANWVPLYAGTILCELDA